MFLLLEVGLSIDKPRIMENGYLDLMDFIKMFFLLCAFGMGFFIVYMIMGIAAENNASTAFQSAISVSLYVWGIIFFFCIVSMVVYYVWWVPTKMSKMTKQQKKENEKRMNGEYDD